MQFAEQYSYPAPFARIWAMYGDPVFTEQRLQQAQMNDVEVTVSGDDSALTMTATGLVDPAMLPAQVQTFVSGKLSLTLTETWKKDSDTAASGTMTVKVGGAPVKVSADCTLAQTGQETARSMDGQLRVQIPLLGGRLEKEAMRFIPRLVEAEKQAAEAYLAQN